jgi:RHS repeat-associated protein
MEYDSSGNLIKRNFKDVLGTLDENYEYDDLGQLKREDGVQSNSYTHDSLNNRLSQNGASHSINLLNQLLQDDKYTYTYDLSGNLIQKNDTSYPYDALDRLIKVQTDQHVFEYSYDELNRCMSITQDKNKIKNLIYLNQAELGACAPSGELDELQILGLGRKTEPCAAVSIELKNIPYAIYRDQTGHIRALVNSQGEIAESYRYSAFGLMETYSNGQSLNNPWTVSGKRYQPEIGLALFGYRFYSPEMGRWITQDPAGITAGPNLYAYLHNSPLVHYDAFGLFEDFDFCDMNAYRSYGEDKVILYNDRFENNNRHAWYPNFCPNFYENSRNFDLSDEGKPSLPSNMGIGFINGIWNDFDGCKESAQYISKLAGGYNINCVFNATHGRVPDVVECHIGLCYTATEPVRQLHNMWNTFFESSTSDSQFLMICHSQGAIHTRNALLDYPEDLRNRIHVVAIAPAAYIYSKTCADVFHYRAAWWRDFVPRLDLSGARRESGNIFDLPSTSESSLFDHLFMSPTYSDKLEFRIKTFIKKYGEKV